MKSVPTLEDYQNRQYRFDVIADPDGGYVIEFPDLPGCMTQVESIDEVSAAAREIFELWMEAAYDEGMDIPEPSYPVDYSGKFLLRLPKSFHRRLAERSFEEGVSLNQLAVAFLAEGPGRVSNLARIAATPLYGTDSAPSLQMVAEDPVDYEPAERSRRKRRPSGA